MKKIKISISVNSIYFSFTNNENNNNINQTSYIDTGSLIFDIQYFVNNPKIISSFINDIVNETKICTIKIKNIELVPIVLKVIKKIKLISKIYILDRKNIDTNTFLAIVDNPNIKFINCYNMSNIMFNYLNKEKNIILELHNQSVKENINNNKQLNYPTIYNKKSISINKILSENELNDLEIILAINKELKYININNYNKETFKYICELLLKYNKRKIKLIINKQTISNQERIDIEKITKHRIKIIYNTNYLKTLNFVLLIFLISLITFLILFIIFN